MLIDDNMNKGSEKALQSLLSVGTCTSRDLAVWDVRNARLKFSLDVGHSQDFTAISKVHKAVICGSADSGIITTVSLTRGSVDHVSESHVYRGMTDLAVSEESVFVATPTNGVVMLSLICSEAAGRLCDPDGPSVPTKLLVNDTQLIVGYRHGLVLVYDLVTQTVVHSLPGHSARVNTLHLLATGQLISAADDHRAIIWNRRDVAVETVTWAEQVRGGDDVTACDVSCMTVDSSQRLVYAGSSSGDVHVWDVETGQCLFSSHLSHAARRDFSSHVSVASPIAPPPNHPG